MKKLLSFVNACLGIAGVLCFLFCPLIALGDNSYTGLQYLKGYSETPSTLFGDVTNEYFLGKPMAGLLIVILLGVLAILSVLMLLVPKKMAKNMKAGFILTLVLAVICATLIWFLAVNDKSLANYGSTSQAMMLLGTEAKITTGAYVFLGCSMASGVLSAFGILLK